MNWLGLDVSVDPLFGLGSTLDFNGMDTFQQAAGGVSSAFSQPTTLAGGGLPSAFSQPTTLALPPQLQLTGLALPQHGMQQQQQPELWQQPRQPSESSGRRGSTGGRGAGRAGAPCRSTLSPFATVRSIKGAAKQQPEPPARPELRLSKCLFPRKQKQTIHTFVPLLMCFSEVMSSVMS